MRLGSINYKKINYSANLELHRKGFGVLNCISPQIHCQFSEKDHSSRQFHLLYAT